MVPQLAVGEGQKPNAFDEFDALAKHLRFAERNSRKLARSTFYLLNRYQAKLEQKTDLLGRIVDIGAELFAMAAACVYANTLVQADPQRREEIFELADLFCLQAHRRADDLFSSLWSNDDAAQYDAAQKVLRGRYTWLEESISDPAGDGPMMPQHEESAEQKFERADDVEALKVPAAATQ